MEETSISRVGSSSEPLKRIKENAARLEAARLASDESQGSTVRLRAYLSIGKSPPKELLTEENIRAALNISDRVAFLPKLAANEKLIKAEVPLHSILSGLKDIGSRNANRLTKNLSRIAAKWAAQAPTVGISDNSVLFFVQILEGISRYQRRAAVSRPSKRTATKNPYVQLLMIGTRWAVSSANPGPLLPLLRIFGSAENVKGMTVENLIADNAEFLNDFQKLLTKSIDRCEELLRQGIVSEFEELSGAVAELPAAKNDLTAKMSKLYLQKARFPVAIQDALRKVLGETTEAPSTPKIQVDDEDSVQTVQLASALVAAWTAKDDGSKAKEAFEELKSVSANFFGLELHGSASQIEDYNPRIHELILGKKPGNRVRLLGPWVEFSRQTRSKVILKAPVEPA